MLKDRMSANTCPGFSNLVVEMERDYIEQWRTEKPDPDWRFTDRAGHTHTWDVLKDTTRWEYVGPPCVCELCEHEDEGYREEHQVCVLCGEEITPGTLPDHDRHLYPTQKSWAGSFRSSRQLEVGTRMDISEITPLLRGNILISQVADCKTISNGDKASSAGSRGTITADFVSSWGTQLLFDRRSANSSAGSMGEYIIYYEGAGELQSSEK